MKKILIYGDSNTWGDNFTTRKRIPDEKQWPNILQKKLEDKAKIIQEGLPGRVAGDEDTEKTFKNGKSSFMPIFRTASPIDILIISLGTNDLQIKYNKSVEEILEYLLWYTKIIEDDFSDEDNQGKYYNNKMPKIIYILPAPFLYEGRLKEFGIFDEASQEKWKLLNKKLKDKVTYIDPGDIELFEDNLHYNINGHQKVANIVYNYLIENKIV